MDVQQGADLHRSSRSLRSLAQRSLLRLFDTRAAAIYMLLFAGSIATGTFIENDFGTSSAQALIYRSTWFSVLLALFCITLAVNVVRFNMVRQRKWPLLTFHVAMIVILIGSAVTRFTGFEGIMHIRENGSSDRILSAESYLQFQVKRGQRTYRFDEPVLFSSLGGAKWSGSYLLGDDLLEVRVNEFIPNPVQVMEQAADGEPTIKIVFGGMRGREEYFLAAGGTARYHGVLFNFSDQRLPDAVNIAFRNDSLLISSDRPLVQRVMATMKVDTLAAGVDYHPLALRAMYMNGIGSFVFGDFNPGARVRITSTDRKVRNDSRTALRVEVTVNGESREMLAYGQKGAQGPPAVVQAGGLDVAVAYGSNERMLPFSLQLHDFIMDRYPGTNSPMSYASEVRLIDQRTGLQEDHRIFMNNVLDHDGYRFFQSSYDEDERGTYLSVNHDRWGTWITYVGYALLTIGMVLTLLDRRSRFQRLAESASRSGRACMAAALVVLSVALPGSSPAQQVVEPEGPHHVIDAEHARSFSRCVVQDLQGRMKPMHTLAREVMRKVYRRESIRGQNADQVLLGMLASGADWVDVPMIKIGGSTPIHDLIQEPGPYATYRQLFDDAGEYRLSAEVRAAMAKEAADRGTYEKDLLKLDERVNILNLVYSGRIFKLVPIPGDPGNGWASRSGSSNGGDHMHGTSPVADRFFTAYTEALNDAMHTANYRIADKLVKELADYQRKNGGSIMPSTSKIEAEILLNGLDVFDRLALLYAFLGIAYLVLLFYSVFRPQARMLRTRKILLFLLIAGFILHTCGLALRWYVSGRAPWSNGYESMIYIAWTTVLAGVLFSRRSMGGSAATMVLSATLLMVAMLSYLDPEITPLVPVLRSYWLTIHVSMEAGSYGFLMLGAVIGLINLLLMVFLAKGNEARVHLLVKEMTVLSEMTLTGGLIMISIGTYLGGVWANESWGRYWGWDAKETWALITILVYAFILHLRLIPGMQGLYTYNLASILGLASVIMTYYGVNYYLSGLHSYAAGDPVPVPQWVYIGSISILIIAALAYVRKRRHPLFR